MILAGVAARNTYALGVLSSEKPQTEGVVQATGVFALSNIFPGPLTKRVKAPW
jgi:hypothetical protein